MLFYKLLVSYYVVNKYIMGKKRENKMIMVKVVIIII